jgi:isoleucyl-tRNA synthetase
VLDSVFHALVRWMAPILCFTTEEAGRRANKNEQGSVHLLEWPDIDSGWRDETLARRWQIVRSVRSAVFLQLEPMRREKVIGSGLEADIHLRIDTDNFRRTKDIDWREVLLTSTVEVFDAGPVEDPSGALGAALGQIVSTKVWPKRTENDKCGRCWRYLPEVEEDGALCARCDGVLNG